jgi:hypothetical protein
MEVAPHHLTTMYQMTSRKTSSGRHLASYFARKRRCTIRQVITPQVQYYNHPYNNKHKSTDKDRKNIPTSDWTFQPLNDLSCHDDSWYDAISPY